MFEVTQDMTGYYTCIAKNELGTDTTRASMTVNKALSPGTSTSFWDNSLYYLYSLPDITAIPIIKLTETIYEVA